MASLLYRKVVTYLNMAPSKHRVGSKLLTEIGIWVHCCQDHTHMERLRGECCVPVDAHARLKEGTRCIWVSIYGIINLGLAHIYMYGFTRPGSYLQVMTMLCTLLERCFNANSSTLTTVCLNRSKQRQLVHVLQQLRTEVQP